MSEETNYTKEGITFRDILYILRANLLLIILIVVLAGAAGAVYSNFRKPYFTATEKVSYTAEVGIGGDDSIIRSYNARSAYMKTAVDFCKTGVVLDTANSYYYYYLKQKDKVGVDEFINRIKDNPDNYPCLSENELKDINYFTVGNVGTKYSGSDSNSSADMFTFSMSVTGLDKDAVRVKVRLLAVAANHEITDFFGGVTSGVIELVSGEGGVSVAQDMSMNRIILIAVIIGIVLAALVVYIKQLTDNTVKNKETLEAITGSNVIAYIDEVDGGSYGRTFAN